VDFARDVAAGGRGVFVVGQTEIGDGPGQTYPNTTDLFVVRVAEPRP
jgi:hypothetical protein